MTKLLLLCFFFLTNYYGTSVLLPLVLLRNFINSLYKPHFVISHHSKYSHAFKAVLRGVIMPPYVGGIITLWKWKLHLKLKAEHKHQGRERHWTGSERKHFWEGTALGLLPITLHNNNN